ncbi:NAD(P)-dependent oxidoreductase [Nocardia puris]|uniref:3-hydroxyisobutyrate dehydrogenase-like beta-hydroxyacid dehydrogenase n=1 Tax=Nocardia puris TaxID=208602 RepID=A0A366E396_9NOCA|nr:NAD(P)-binding domain-containing protein [Nocardia puris]MBF6209745.1 NAD(P)-dependent oxidoreductase [Nocardia puris]MBF6366317.1 NAD(P)-dependent oxidoreductase [Nocardia puris]MBF6458344.1 NAD(P)-dependent oxidoreductase [Nocardia puris]RBO95994.1 3-hydroxyisobutyrate dehydrogenase-like beta-hydroxyacid dehydrogenase [Nocardia puris]
MTVAVLGLGEMGSALATAVLDAGHPLIVWNRSAAKAETLVAKGARLAASPEAAVAEAELVIVNVQGGEIAVDLLRSVGGALAGRTVVNLTDGPSERAAAAAESVAAHYADYLHGQIMTIAPAIGSPDAVIFYGGPRPVFDRHEPILRALGGRATHVSEDPRVPLVYGLAFHDIMWGLLNGFLHAAALLGDAGIPIVRYAEQAEPALAGLPGLFPMLAGEIDRAEFATPFGALKHHLPSLEDLIAESRARGIDTEFPTYTGRLVADTLAAGHGDDSYSRLVEHFGRR